MSVMASIPRGRAVLIGLWVLVGVAGAAAAWSTSRRPANARATALVLEPKAGTYGPVRLSLMNVPLSPTVLGATPDTGFVLVNADRPGSQVFLVGVPSLTAYLTGEGQA